MKPLGQLLVKNYHVTWILRSAALTLTLTLAPICKIPLSACIQDTL